MRDRTCSRRLTKFALYETLGDGMGPCGHARMTRISLAVLATMLLAACITHDAGEPAVPVVADDITASDADLAPPMHRQVH